MLTSISPVGENSRNQRWWLTATAHVVGAAAGGAAVGLAVGSVGALALSSLPFATRLLLLVIIAMVGLVIDAGWSPVALPTIHRQVNERWLTELRGWIYGIGFGLQLGAAVVTIVPASITYVMLAAGALTADPLGGAAIGLTFGLSRSAPLIATRRVRDPGRLRVMMRRMNQVAPLAERGTGATQFAVAASGAILLAAA